MIRENDRPAPAEVRPVGPGETGIRSRIQEFDVGFGGSVPVMRAGERGRDWTFLTNHAHVLLCLAADQDVLLRSVTQQVGITERAVQLIVADLSEAGYITRVRVGRRNHYVIEPRGKLRHPLESHRTVELLLQIVTTPTPVPVPGTGAELSSSDARHTGAVSAEG